MAQELEEIKEPLTRRQEWYIRGLIEKGLIKEGLEYQELSKAEASQVISQALEETLMKSDGEVVIESDNGNGYFEQSVAHQETEPEPIEKESERVMDSVGTDIGQVHRPVNGVRLGMAAKLVYSTNPPNLSRADSKAKSFKSEVRRMYGILSEIEAEMAAN